MPLGPIPRAGASSHRRRMTGVPSQPDLPDRDEWPPDPDAGGQAPPMVECDPHYRDLAIGRRLRASGASFGAAVRPPTVRPPTVPATAAPPVDGPDGPDGPNEADEADEVAPAPGPRAAPGRRRAALAAAVIALLLAGGAATLTGGGGSPASPQLDLTGGLVPGGGATPPTSTVRGPATTGTGDRTGLVSGGQVLLPVGSSTPAGSQPAGSPTTQGRPPFQPGPFPGPFPAPAPSTTAPAATTTAPAPAPSTAVTVPTTEPPAPTEPTTTDPPAAGG